MKTLVKDLSISSDGRVDKITFAKNDGHLAFSTRVLGENDPIWVGETKGTKKLGKSIVEILLTDVELDSNLRDKFDSERTLHAGTNLIKSIYIGFPPDDSLVAFYFGLNSKTKTEYLHGDTSFTIIFRN